MLDIWLIWASFMLLLALGYFHPLPLWILGIIGLISIVLLVIIWKRSGKSSDDVDDIF